MNLGWNTWKKSGRNLGEINERIPREIPKAIRRRIFERIKEKRPKGSNKRILGGVAEYFPNEILISAAIGRDHPIR